MELGKGWTIFFVLLPGAGLLVAALRKLARGWRLLDMRKGAHAEETVGQAIEYALTRERCAVAHHVEGIARIGDIDHLVATPRGLWVIETKDGRVPRSDFQESLRRIALNVEAVRDWVPGMRVTGCFVIATGRGSPPKPTYGWGAETIRCFGSAVSLMREVQTEARSEAVLPSLPEGLAARQGGGSAKSLGGSLSDSGGHRPAGRIAASPLGRGRPCGATCGSGMRSISISYLISITYE